MSNETVRYGAFDGRLRMREARELASQHANGQRVHSWVDDEHFIVAVGDRKLVVNPRRNKYDILVGEDIVGKFNSWDAAAAKFKEVLSETV